MPERPDPKEKKESCCGEHSQSALLRSVERRLDLDREYTDKVFKRLLLSINTQMASAEQRIIAKLEEIDTTLSIISREIARHTDDPQSEDVGHRH